MVYPTEQFIEEGKFNDIDQVNLEDEIQTLARMEYRTVRSHTQQNVAHLLKMQYVSEEEGNQVFGHWNRKAKTFRENFSPVINDISDLNSQFSLMFVDSWEGGVLEASDLVQEMDDLRYAQTNRLKLVMFDDPFDMKRVLGNPNTLVASQSSVSASIALALKLMGLEFTANIAE